ncbi:tol-pal system protein YbgF [Celerinatantimonas sp. YJH-8]|uniref:tol-pal system protein YbgF n=1 Tax=Celerinatantimonas sp. YJH-8 TaxID=3228714 RepID=UPI0038C0DEB1
MRLLKVSAVAIAAAFGMNVSFADVPVTDLSIVGQSEPAPVTLTAGESSPAVAAINSSAISATSAQPNTSQSVPAPQATVLPPQPKFDDTSHMTVQQRIERLERMFNARSESSLAIRQQLAQLADEFADLNGKIEQQRHQIEQIVQRERDLYQEMDRRFAQLQTNGTASTDSSSHSTTLEPVAPAGNEQADYDKAVKLVMQDRQFAKAIPAFETFLTQYPQSQYVPNAHYWLGQLQYTQGQQDKAAEQFKAVIDQFPKSSKVPESLMKLGQLALQQQHTDEAKQYFTQLVTRFPDSSAARLAKTQLTQLNK